MRAEVIGTLIGVALLVGALAIYLSLVAYHLVKVNYALGTVIIGLRAIADQTRPVGGVISTIAADVEAMDQALKSLVGVATAPQQGRAARAAPTAPAAPTQSRRTRARAAR